MVRRDVVQVVTKGTRIDASIDSKSNNYIANVYNPYQLIHQYN